MASCRTFDLASPLCGLSNQIEDTFLYQNAVGDTPRPGGGGHRDVILAIRFLERFRQSFNLRLIFNCGRELEDRCQGDIERYRHLDFNFLRTGPVDHGFQQRFAIRAQRHVDALSARPDNDRQLAAEDLPGIVLVLRNRNGGGVQINSLIRLSVKLDLIEFLIVLDRLAQLDELFQILLDYGSIDQVTTTDQLQLAVV